MRSGFKIARILGINVNAEVKNGEVTLTGAVADRASKRLAEDLSDSVYGVRDVHNQLHFEGRPEHARPVEG